MNQRACAREILERLKRIYRVRGPFVVWKNPLELLIGTVLSSQCTDKRVNIVTKTLFKKYKIAKDYARAKLPVLEKEIYSTGFYKTKAKYLKGIGQALQERYGGEVPNRLEELLTLPGVARKTANLIMAKAFGTPIGIAVDTHVFRVAPRLGLTKSKTPDAMARDLEALYIPKDYLAVNEYMIMHGRAICAPRKPKCPSCVLKNICPSAKKFYPEIAIARD
ncbi:endonuclease III [Candidatus Uhrbacteria bacterium]|nr:endonuclease III [Candidatus Uhrbacteria bacterium]